MRRTWSSSSRTRMRSCGGGYEGTVSQIPFQVFRRRPGFVRGHHRPRDRKGRHGQRLQARPERDRRFFRPLSNGVVFLDAGSLLMAKARAIPKRIEPTIQVSPTRIYRIIWSSFAVTGQRWCAPYSQNGNQDPRGYDAHVRTDFGDPGFPVAGCLIQTRTSPRTGMG